MNDFFQGELRIFDLLLPQGYLLILNVVRAEGLYCRKDKATELLQLYGVVITNGKMKYPQNTQLACPTGYLLNSQKRQEAGDEKGWGLLLEAERLSNISQHFTKLQMRTCQGKAVCYKLVAGLPLQCICHIFNICGTESKN